MLYFDDLAEHCSWGKGDLTDIHLKMSKFNLFPD